MTKTLLPELGFTPARIGLLSGNERNRLLNFLERWGYPEELHACLDVILTAQPTLVSLLDLRVRAYVAQQHYAEAMDVARARLELRRSMSAAAAQVSVALAQGDLDTAEGLLTDLLRTSPDSATAWRLKGEVALARGNPSAAMAAFHQLGELTSQGRGYLLSMMSVYEAQNDWVTASGYAVRALTTAEVPEDLPPTTLRRLLTYFEASEEETRARRVREALEARYAQELDALKAALRPYLSRADDPRQAASRRVAGPGEAEAQDFPIEPVPVSDQERQAVAQAVRETFGFKSLLPGQLETMAAVLRGENVLSILPTGGGKSLCYQVPAMIAEVGTTLVISPLIALMKDQVDSLPAGLRARAATINSSLDGDTLHARLAQTAAGRFRLLYAAPERLRQPTFLHALRRAGINRLVIDEAHCVSVWGHDFRPDYLKIAEAWDTLGRPPILALTATAPPRVRRDIIQHLSPDHPMATVVGDMVRANLHLEVVHAANLDEKYRHLVTFCKATPGSGIVYADTRARCEELASLLRDQGVDAAHYHAGIENRAEVQDAFMSGETRIIVATIAFGMGIDKPDIRFIIHFMPPASLESYYQEAGRAGRDGQPARCLLMMSQHDRGLLTRRMKRDLPTVEFLREVYAVTNRYLQRASPELGFQAIGSIAAGDLERSLRADDTRIRVAISILEENGLLQRGPDAPRAALVRLRRSPTSPGDDGFRAFCDTAHLRADQWVQCNLIDTALRAGLSPMALEYRLLGWSDAGTIDCRFSGRNMLVARTEPPGDVAERISLWLDRFTTIQIQRIDEITAYATTDHCRHGHLSAYLGGRRVERCAACDNCVMLQPAGGAAAWSHTAALPDEREQYQIILSCLDETSHGWGQVTLVRILRGDRSAPTKAQQGASFGALSFRSQQALKDMITQLVSHELLALRKLDNVAEFVELAEPGYAALRDPSRLDALLKPPPKAAPAAVDLTEAEEAVFQRLRAWRLEQARARQVAPYIIFHDSHLRAIATSKPRTPEELLAIKGIGARKLKAYGGAVLAILHGGDGNHATAAPASAEAAATDSARADDGVQ